MHFLLRMKGLAIVGCVVAATCSQANLVQAYSNFGAGLTFDTTDRGLAVGIDKLAIPSPTYVSACQFIPDWDISLEGTAAISEIILPITLHYGDTDLHLTLLSDSGNNTPGSPVLGASWELEGLVANGTPTLHHVVASGPPVELTRGVKYWLQVSDPPSYTGPAAEWNLDMGETGPVGLSTNGGAFTTQTNRLGAMEINVDAARAPAVPEPFTMALCAAGLGLAYARRRRR